MSDNIITIEESPYGDTGAVYVGNLGIMNHFCLQLKSFRNQNKTPEERQYLEDDISGYEEILKSNSEENATSFMVTKSEAMRAGKRFKNNLEIINHLKETGKWL